MAPHTCYSNFTHQGKIARLNKKGLNLNAQKLKTKIVKCPTRSNKQHAVDWSLCVCFVKRVGGRQLGMLQLWNDKKK